MGGLNSGPGPGITLVIAIVLVLAQTVSSAPLYEEDEGQESNSQSLAESHGCYYNFQHYNEGERILTNEPCLNCTCRNRMLMCYLRVCPFTKGIGQNCTVEKVPGQCCPIITCPEVPVQLLTSTTTEGVKAPGGYHGTKGSAVGHLDTNGCNIDGIFYPNGAQVPGSPEKPCELCYCIRNKTACIMQECALHVDGCRPVYEEGQCFPVRYQCDDSPYEEESTTTIRPAPTPGLIITSTFAEPLDCSYNSEVYEDGSRIQTEDPCEHCYCLKGKIACAVQECGAPLEKEGQNCTALPPAPGKCCPDSYQCDVTITSQGLNHDSEPTTEARLPSEADAGHPTDGFHPDQGIRTTEKPKYTTNRLDHITETVTTSKGVGEQKPTVKPQELDKGTQNELTESHLQGLHPTKTSSISDGSQKITFHGDNNESVESSGGSVVSEIGQPEATLIKKPESLGHTTYSDITDTSNEKRPHTESISHVLDVSTEVPETAKPTYHLQGTVAGHSDEFGNRPNTSLNQIPYTPTTSNVLSLKPQISTPDAKDTLLDKLHNIIQDVQAQVSDGKTTETPEQVDYETTMQSQTGHFTDKSEIVSHLSQPGSQTSASGLTEMGNTMNGTAPDDSSDIINKLQGIIQGIHSYVTDSLMSTKTPESSTVAGETQSSISSDSSGIIKPESASESETAVSEKESLKPHNGSVYPKRPIEIKRPYDTEKTGESEVKDKHSSKHTTEKIKPEIYSTELPETTGSVGVHQGIQYPDISGGSHDSKYSTKTPFGTHVDVIEPTDEIDPSGVSGDPSSKYPKKPEGIKPEVSIKLPLRPKPEGSGSDDEPYGMKYPETVGGGEEETYITEYPYMTDKPDLNKYPQKTDKYSEKTKPVEGGEDSSGGFSATKKPFDKEKYPGESEPDQDDFGSTKYSEQTKVTSSPPEQSHYFTKFPQSGSYPEGSKPGMQYPERFKPSGQYPQVIETTEQYPENVTAKPGDETKYPAGVSPSGQYPEEFTPEQSNEIKPVGTYSEGSKPTVQHPEGVKPSGQYPDGYTSGQQYPDSNEPVEQYPNKTKPESSTNSSFQIKYPEGVTGKPDDDSKFPEDTGVILSGQYPEEIKPTDQFSNGSKQPEKTKPMEFDGTPFGTEYPEELTGKPSDDKEYLQVSKFPDKAGQNGTEVTQSSSSESSFGSTTTESSVITSTPGNMSERPEVFRPTDEYLNPEKYPGRPAESKPYNTEYPEKSGVTSSELFTKLPDIFTKDPEILKSGRPGETDRPEISTKHSESGNFRPDDQSQYLEVYKPAYKPSGTYPEGVKHPFDKNQPHGSAESEDTPSKYQHETQVFNKPKPGSDIEPSATEYPKIAGKPDKFDGIGVTDSVGVFSKYPEKTKPEATTFEAEDLEEITGKPDGENKHPESVKPVNEYPYSSKYSTTGRPESIKKPYGSEHPEASEAIDKPEKESKYPERFKPLDEHLQKPKPGSEVDFYESDHLETTAKPELSYEGSTYKSPSTQKPGLLGHPDTLKPTQQNPENFKYPQKPGIENKPYGNEFSDSTDKPDMQMQFTGYADDNAVTEKPDSDDDDDYSSEYPEKVTKGPMGENAYPQKQKTKDEPENEPQVTEHLKRPEISDVPNSEEKQHGTEYSERVTEKPANSSKHPDETEELEKHPQKPESEYPNQVSTERPTPDSSEGNVMFELQETTKYPEESYVTQYPEKIKPPSADQLLETGTKPDDLSKYSEKPKPVTEQNEIDKLEDEIKYPEKSKPSSGEGSMTRPADSNRPDVSSHLKEPGKPTGTYESSEEITKRPHYSTQYPQKPSDKPSGPEYSEEIDKPQYPTGSEYPGKIKPIKFPSGPGSGISPQGTEYPETDKPSEAVYNKDETGVTDKPHDLIHYTDKSKPGSLDNSKDQTKYPAIPDFEEEPFGASATDKPEGNRKHPDSLKNPIKVKPDAENKSNATEQLKVSETDQPFHTKYSEVITGKPEYPGQQPEKFTPVNTEKLDVSSTLDGGSQFPQTPGDVAFGTEYPNAETGTGKPEDPNKYPNGFKPMGQKYPHVSEHFASSSKPEYESKYPIDFTHYTQRPYDSESYSSPEHPDNELNEKPEHHTKFPERIKPGETERPQYPEAEKPYESELSYGTESSASIPEHHVKYPEKFKPIGTDPEVTEKTQYSTKYPESSTKYPEEITDRPQDYTKYPEGFKPSQKYPGKPHDSDKYPEHSKPSISESTYTSEGPDVSQTEKPENFTKYTGDLTTKEHYEGATENIHDFTKHPKDSHSFSTSYPELGLTEHSEGIKPTEPHPEQPQVSEENSDLSSFHDTENPNTGENDKSDLSTKYSEDKDHITEYPIGTGTIHEQHSTDKHLEGSKLTGSLHGTEPTRLSGTSNEYTQKFKPGYETPHSDSITEYPVEGKPTETYPHESERPEQNGKPLSSEQEKPFETGVTVGSDTSRNPDETKPVSSEATIQGTEYPESMTNKPEVVEYSEGSKGPDESETKTESSESVTGEAAKESEYPEGPRPTTEYPHYAIKYPQRPIPGFEHEPYGTENLEPANKPEDQTEFTTYAYEGSTSKYPQRPESEVAAVTNLSDDLSEHSHGFKPSSGNYPENLDITTGPHGSTIYTQKKPVVESSTTGIQYHNEINIPESSTRFPDNKNTESTEFPEVEINVKPQQNQYPEEFRPTGQDLEEAKHSETARPKPVGLYETPFSTEYPETTGSENDIGITEIPEYLGQYSSIQYPQRPIPTVSQGEPQSTEYTEEMGFTEKPEGENKYPDKIEQLTNPPLPERPRPIGSDQLFVTKYPTAVGKPGSSRYPEKPILEHEEGHYVHSETTIKPDSEDEVQSTGILEVSDKYFHGSIPTERPYGTEYPEDVKPGITGRPHISTKNTEAAEEQEVTEFLGETEVTDTPENSHKSPGLHSQDSEKTHQTLLPEIHQKYPDRLKPTSEHPEVSGSPHIPNSLGKKPVVADDESHGAEYSKMTEKPENEPFGTEETVNAVKPENEKHPENNKITGKPHGVQVYPQRPESGGLEDVSSGTEYPETTEEFDETSLAQGQSTFGKYPSRPKPSTKFPEESDVTGESLEIHRYPDETKTKPEDDQFISTELPEEQKPEGFEPSKYPLDSHDPKPVFENIPYDTGYLNNASGLHDNENENHEMFKPSEKRPDKYGVTEKPYDSNKYTVNLTEDGEKLYSTEYTQITESTEQPKGSKLQKPEDKINGSEIFGMTVSSHDVPTDEFSIKFSSHKPETGYLPQGGGLPNEKTPGSENLEENSTTVFSEHLSSTEAYFGFTDRIPTTGSSAEKNSLSTLHHFESHQNKPPSVDLTHDLETSFPSQELITKYSERHTTTPSHLGPGQFPVKPTDEAKPVEPESTKPENGSPTSVDDYPGRPKPIVPGEGLYSVQDPNTNFVEPSSIPSGGHKDNEFPSKISETERPEVPSGAEISITKKPGDEDLSPETESRHSSTAVPSTNKYPSSVQNLTGDVQHSKDISTFRPEDDDYTTPGKHKTTTLKQLTDENQESTNQPSNINTHLEEVFSTERPTDHTNYENYPEGISLPVEGFTRIPSQDSVSSNEGMTDVPQGLYLPEKNSTEMFSDFQKTTTPSDDLINKLHDIISGIQLQVTEKKTTKLPYGIYESTSPVFSAEIPQDYHPTTDKFGRPVQKPQEFSKLPHGQHSESLTTPSRYPTDGIFSSENEIYDQTTTDAEKPIDQTERPQFSYTSVGESTEHSVLMTSKNPEGIQEDDFSTKSPHQQAAAGYPHEELKPVSAEDKPENTEFPEPEIPYDTKHPESFVSSKITSYPDQSSSTSKYPTDELLITGKPQFEEGSNSTQLSGTPTTSDVKYSEGMAAQFSQKPSAFDSVSFSEYPEDVSTTVSTAPFDDSGKPDLPDENQVMTVTSIESGITGKPSDTITSRPDSQEHKNKTTQIYQELKGSQKPAENVDKLITEDSTAAPRKPITEDLLHTVIPQDVSQNHSILISTDKPLHVVYPTYYPDGIVTRKPGGKPDGETDKKVTVTPQSTIHEDASVKNPESDSTSTSKPAVIYTIYEVHTEIGRESSTTPPVVIVEEVHTEVHSERATTESDAESHFEQTVTPFDVKAPELNQGKPHGYKPEHDFEKFTKQPETFPSQTPQIVFGQSASVQPVDQSTPKSQTLQPPAGYPDDKFSDLSTHAQYPDKQPESSTKTGFVTVTPIEIDFPTQTKESEHIMHLYSPKDKHPSSISSTQYPESFTTATPVYPESVKHTTRKGETETQTVFVTDFGAGTTQKSEISGTRFPSRKTTQKPTEGVPAFQEITTITSTEGIGEEYQAPHVIYSGATNQPSFDISTEGYSVKDKVPDVYGFTSTEEGTTQRPQGASFVPYKLINGSKVYYPEKESPERPTSESSPFDGYDHIPYEIVNGTKFFYPNRVVTSQPEFTKSTVSTLLGMYVPYKIVNGTKVYYTQDKPQKPEKFDGLDYMPFDIINGTKIFYPERVTVTQYPTHPGSAMYVPFKIIDGTKMYYPKEAQEEPQNIPDEYDGFDYVPYDIVNGNKVFHPDHIPGHVPSTTERLPAMYVPYKLINGNRVYYPKDAQIKPESVPEEYDGFDLVPYEVVNGTKLFYPDPATTQKPEEVSTKTPGMLVPFKIINGTKVYFPKHAQNKPPNLSEGYDGFDYLPYENVNGTKVFRPEEVTGKPEFTSTPAFYSSGMFVPYKIVNNTKVFFPKDAQHKPRPLKSGYDGVQYLPYEIINGTKVFYPEKATTPTPILPSAQYVPYKFINGTKVYYADKATENPEEIPEGYEGFDYVPYEIVNGNKLFYPDRLKPTTGMYVPYKKINGSKVYYPKDSSEKHQPVPEGYDGIDYVPYEIVNGTRVFYPDRATTSQPTLVMYVPYKMINGTKVYHPKDAQHKPNLVPEGYDGFDSLPYEIVNRTKVFHPENVTQRPMQTYPQGMFVPYKVINGTKIYYPQEAHKRPHPLSDEYAGLDYIPYEVVNGTKVFHPERVTPNAIPAMYVPYKLINGTKVFYPKHAQHNSQLIPSEYDGFDYVPYEIINGTQVFYPNRVPNYQGMYVPYKIFNGEKVFYPKYAQHKPSEIPDGYDGFDYLPYESVNGIKVFKPVKTATETPLEQAMYVPYKVVNETKVLYTEYAQYKPHLIPQGFDGFDYIPYEIVNGTKVFDPDLAAAPGMPYKPAMYVPFKIINGKKVYYPKLAQDKPHLIPEGYDGFDYIPYEIVNGTKIFNPEEAYLPGTNFRPSLYVPYKLTNGIKVYQPKYAQHKPSQIPQGYDGFDYLPYDVINGNKVFHPEQSVPLKQAMYVPFKLINGTKIFYPKYAQHVPVQTPEDFDGFEYIPYEIVNGDKIFHPEQVMPTETPFRKAMYVPYKIVNGTKTYYPKNSQYIPYLIPAGYDGFDYLPYEVVNGNKVFHPEQVTIPETDSPFKQAMYVPFKAVNGTKVYYPKQAQSKPLLIPEGYDGFDYLPYEVVNGTKVFDSSVSSKPTYLEGMFVPYKLANNTKVFYPKDAHNKPNYIPEGYDGADYVPYEILNNTKIFYPELISTVQPGKQGSAGVYVPFKIVNNKKVFHPKEATPFPLKVHYPYDGVAFVPLKTLGETSPSEIVYVEDNETFKPYQTLTQSGQVPGEGSCYMNNKTFANNTEVPPVSPCQARCVCISSVIRCVRVKCPLPPKNKLDCSPVYREGSCCPTYACGDSDYEYPTTATYPGTKVPLLAENASPEQGVDASTPFTEYETQKRPSHESGDITGGKKPGVQAPSEEYHLHKPPKPKPKPEHESLEPYDTVEGQLTPDEDYDVEDEEPYGPGTCRYAGKVYVSAQQIPRDDPCDFCFCFRSDIICLQQSCPPPIPGCRDEPIQGFCCPRYECHVKMANLINVTSTTTTTTTTLPPHFFPHAFKGSATKTGCFVQGRAYRVGQAIPSASGPCMDCICGGNGRMKCEPKVCTPEPMIRKMISPSENTTSTSSER